jgi:hypothetical protein
MSVIDHHWSMHLFNCDKWSKYCWILIEKKKINSRTFEIKANSKSLPLIFHLNQTKIQSLSFHVFTPMIIIQ